MRENQQADSHSGNCSLIAPIWHMVTLLGVFAALTILGWYAQRSFRARPPSPSPASPLVPLQIQAIIFEWAALAWVCFGVRRKGVRVRELIGGRWPDPKSVFVDALLGGAIWAIWIAINRAQNFLFADSHSPDTIPYPSNLLESFLAIGVAVSAGVCEEIVFRGYFQRQFWALTGSAGVAVLLQAVVFGVPHVYQGTRLVATTCLYGILFGVLALWRHSLRPGILAHSWSDIAARLLRT